MDFYELGKALAELRKSKSISQATMANDLHISRATISNFENGSCTDIGLKKVMAIADYVGVELQLKDRSPFPTFEEVVDG